MNALSLIPREPRTHARGKFVGALGPGLATVALYAGSLAIGVGIESGGGFIASADAAPKLCEDGTRPPCNEGGGGKPDEPGPGSGKGKGDLFADLTVLWRDVDGLPLYVQVPGGVDDETALPTGVDVPCLQPIFAPAAPLGTNDVEVTTYTGYVSTRPVVPTLTNPVTNPADSKSVSPVPLGGTGIEGEECDASMPTLTTTDYTTCDPDGNGDLNNICPQEVDFGRLSVARSPQRVLDQQLREVQKAIQNAVLTLDHAGRLVYDGAATIDSPVQNLAIHQALMIAEQLTSQTQTPIPLPDPGIQGYSFLDHAASALGAAAEKGGLVDLDLIVYNNRVLDIPNQTIGETVVGNGNVGQDGELYYHYEGYTYDRDAKYRGCVTGFFLINNQPVPFSGPIKYYAFNNTPFIGSNIYGFATAADDSMRVITFVHDNTVTNVDKVGERTEAWCGLVDPRT